MLCERAHLPKDTPLLLFEVNKNSKAVYTFITQLLLYIIIPLIFSFVCVIPCLFSFQEVKPGLTEHFKDLNLTFEVRTGVIFVAPNGFLEAKRLCLLSQLLVSTSGLQTI